MAVFMKCGSCAPASLKPYFPDAADPEPTHCHGSGDRPAPNGVLGGMVCSCPCRYRPDQLHSMAHNAYPTDRDRAVARYNELMVEAGFVIVKEDSK